MGKSTSLVCRLSLTGALGAGLALLPIALASPAMAQQTQTQASRSDLAIESDVLHQLNATPGLNDQGISASTENGTVTLNGSVADRATSELAQATAGAVSGVRAVMNNITVGGGTQAGPQQPETSSRAGDAPAAQQPPSGAPATAPEQSTSASPYPESGQPQPGTKGSWGQAGPPPDAQNGEIPPPPSGQIGDGQGGSQQPEQPPEQSGNGYPPQGSRSYPPNVGYPPPNQNAPQQGYPAPANRPYPSEGRARGGYARTAPPTPTGPVSVPQGTLLTVRTSEPLDTRRLQDGDYFQVTVAADVFEGNALAIPRGAVLQGRVLQVNKAGVFRGSAGLALQLTTLNLSGQSYPLATDIFVSDTRGKGGYTAANTVGGAAIGALIGAVAGGGGGAAIGALAGGGTGAGISAATPGPRDVLPPETLLNFHLAAPVTVASVSYGEAQRLAASVEPPRRPYVRPRPYRYPPPPPYGYPPPPPPYYPY